MTTAGRLILAAVVVLGGGLTLVLAVADAETGGVHGDQAGGVLLVFGVVVVGAAAVIVVAFDALFRCVRHGARLLRP